MNDQVIKTKTTGNFNLVVVERSFDNGRVTYGFGSNGGIRFGYSKSQALRLIRVHNANDAGDVLYYCG